MFTDRQTAPILGAVVVCTLPHLFNVSLPVVVICLSMWLYTVAAAKYSWRLPNRLLMGLLTVFLLAVAMTTHEGFTLEAFVALLALMINMKLLETGTGKDRTITVILCYFLIVTALFFGDSIGATLYLFFSILWTTAMLIHVNHPGHGPFPSLKLSGILMAQALPVALVLFLFFPRIQGGLWGRAPVNSAQTGFSDSMSFGNIAKLARNSDVAFRVEFDDPMPPREHLYWRGIVLWDFDGVTWRRGLRRSASSLRPQKASLPVRHTVILEPHNEHWLLTLDLPLRVTFRRAWLNSDHTCYRWWPITHRISYSVISDIDAHAGQDKELRNKALALPASGNPRTRQLAKRLAAEARDPTAYVAAILEYFRDRPFIYTLRPPPLSVASDNIDNGPGNDLIDRFLFESRKGFCEHFAGSFAFLMRAAGVPARIVLGYQGGEMNSYGGYLVVRQSDAHAWCEVWMEDRGWVRVDPTGFVAPARLRVDTANALSPGESAGLLFLLNRGPFGELISALDFLNSRWNRWVMDYSPYEDLDFLVRLGIDTESRRGWGQALLIVLSAGTAVTAAIMIILLFRLPADEKDEIGRAWIAYCRKLAAAGFPRHPAQGPVDYMRHIVSQRPELADPVREITSCYIQLRFSGLHGKDEIRLLKRMIRKFTP